VTVDELIKKLTRLPGNMDVIVIDNEGNVQDTAAFTRGSLVPTSRGEPDDARRALAALEFIQDEVEGKLAAIVVW
jgi:hypothetical protein